MVTGSIAAVNDLWINFSSKLEELLSMVNRVVGASSAEPVVASRITMNGISGVGVDGLQARARAK